MCRTDDGIQCHSERIRDIELSVVQECGDTNRSDQQQLHDHLGREYRFRELLLCCHEQLRNDHEQQYIFNSKTIAKDKDAEWDYICMQWQCGKFHGNSDRKCDPGLSMV